MNLDPVQCLIVIIIKINMDLISLENILLLRPDLESSLNASYRISQGRLRYFIHCILSAQFTAYRLHCSTDYSRHFIEICNNKTVLSLFSPILFFI